MNRPAPEVLLTVVLVVVLAGAGAGVAMLGTRSPAADLAPPPPTTASPSAPAPTPPPPALSPARPSPADRPTRARTPRPPAVIATACPDLSRDVPLRVVSFNVHFGIGPGGFDIGRLAATIRRWQADVVLLQEVDRFRPRSRYLDMPAVLARMTGMEAAFGANVRRGRSEYGVATLSRHPIVMERNTHLPNRPGLQQRGLLRTDIDVDGTVVSIYNTHLQNGVESMRMEQVAAIAPLVTASENPVVLGGDLNSGPGSPVMRRVGGFARDVWADGGAGVGHTAPARDPRYRIDYVMYTAPLRVERAQVLPDLLSDHRAVSADLVLSTVADEVCVPQLDGPMDQDGPDGG